MKPGTRADPPGAGAPEDDGMNRLTEQQALGQNDSGWDFDGTGQADGR